MSDQKAKLRDFYTQILSALDVTVTEDGTAVMQGVGDTLRPVTVSNDEVMVLPTEARLKSGDWAGVQPFHPISENALRGESVVLKKLRILAAARVTSTVQTAMHMLVSIAADTKLHGKLSPAASKFLDHATKADAKTIDKVKAVMDKVSISGDHRLVAFYFNRPGEQKKSSYTRSCRVDFPVFDEFNHKEHTVFGVKMRIADKEVLKGLFQWLFDVDDETMFDTQALFDLYGAGTQTLTVPYFTTLMQSYAKLAKQLNKKLKLFSKTHGDLVKELHIDTEWTAELDDLAKYRDIIPPLRGNEGATASHPGKRAGAEIESGTASVTAAPVHRRPSMALGESVGSAGQETPSIPQPQQQPQQQAPVPPPHQPQQPQPAPVQNNGLISWSALNPPVAQQPYGNPGYPQPGFAPQPQGWGQEPVYGAMNARDMMRRQAYQQYQQHPQSYYDPNVYSQVMVPPIPPQQQFAPQPLAPQPAMRTVQPSPSSSGVRMPSRW